MRLRALTRDEARLAGEVFGDALDLRCVRLVMKAPTGGWAIALFGLILFPRDIEDFAAAPIHLQAWLIHELTHAWQFQARPWWTLVSWARVALSGGYLTRAAYRYALPIDWDRLNLEQQAKVIEHRFLVERGAWASDMPEGVRSADFLAIPLPCHFPRHPRARPENPSVAIPMAERERQSMGPRHKA